MMLHTPHLGEAMTQVTENGISYTVPTNPPRSAIDIAMGLLPESVSRYINGMGLGVVALIPVALVAGFVLLSLASKKR